MLVLFKGEVDVDAPVPAGEMFSLCGKQVETLKKYRDEGKILAGGIIAGAKGSYAIFDVESIEELQGLVAQTPLFPYGKFELIPLISYEFALEGASRLAGK